MPQSVVSKAAEVRCPGEVDEITAGHLVHGCRRQPRTTMMKECDVVRIVIRRTRSGKAMHALVTALDTGIGKVRSTCGVGVKHP